MRFGLEFLRPITEKEDKKMYFHVERNTVKLMCKGNCAPTEF